MSAEIQGISNETCAFSVSFQAPDWWVRRADVEVLEFYHNGMLIIKLGET